MPQPTSQRDRAVSFGNKKRKISLWYIMVSFWRNSQNNRILFIKWEECKWIHHTMSFGHALKSDGLMDQQTTNELFVFRACAVTFICHHLLTISRRNHTPWHTCHQQTLKINLETRWETDVRVDRGMDGLRYNCLLAAKREIWMPVSDLPRISLAEISWQSLHKWHTPQLANTSESHS